MITRRKWMAGMFGALAAGGMLAASEAVRKDSAARPPAADPPAPRPFPGAAAAEAIPLYPRGFSVGRLQPRADGRLQLCQGYVEMGRTLHGVDGYDCVPGGGEPQWNHARPIPWQAFGPGEYLGYSRTQHVPEYRLRVDDELDFIYRLTREESREPYELNVGDQIRLESLTDANLDRDLVIQPDGTITVRLLGQVRAGGRTVEELRAALEEAYKRFYKVPAITVTPLQVNTKLEDLRATIDSRFGNGGQTRTSRVTPDGMVNLPAIGAVPAQGLTLTELKLEIDERYRQVVKGIEVTPDLRARAPAFVYVVGEVRQGGRFPLESPTTAMQGIALAGGWNQGGNLRQIVLFRRGADWRLLATRLDLSGALNGARPSPADELWLRDSDILVVPKKPIQHVNEFIDMVFTRGAYGVLPFSASVTFSNLGTL